MKWQIENRTNDAVTLLTKFANVSGRQPRTKAAPHQQRGILDSATVALRRVGSAGRRQWDYCIIDYLSTPTARSLYGQCRRHYFRSTHRHRASYRWFITAAAGVAAGRLLIRGQFLTSEVELRQFTIRSYRRLYVVYLGLYKAAEGIRRISSP